MAGEALWKNRGEKLGGRPGGESGVTIPSQSDGAGELRGTIHHPINDAPTKFLVQFPRACPYLFDSYTRNTSLPAVYSTV